MNISNDINAYKLSQLLEIFGDEDKSKFLFKYWVKTNKLRYLPKFIGQTDLSIAPDEIQYVIALETLLETLIDTLKNFIDVGRYCSQSILSLEIDVPTLNVCNDLISALKDLQDIYLRSGLSELYEDLSKAILKITIKIDRLIAFYNSGKRFHFIANINAEDFISSEAINFGVKRGKYFVIDAKNWGY